MSPTSTADERLLHIEHDGAITHLRLNRAAKRNAISDGLIALLHTTFINLPEPTRAVVISGEGDHFCAGLDLAEVSERSVLDRRTQDLRITRQGERVVVDALARLLEADRGVVKQLTEAERLMLLQLLRKVARSRGR